MQWILCYDISDHKARRRAMRILRAQSLGYQKSSFELPYTGAQSLNPLLDMLAPHISEQDKLLLLHHSGLGPDWQLGRGPSANDSYFLIWQ